MLNMPNDPGIQKYLHDLIDIHLDREVPRTQQTMAIKRLVYEEV